LRSSRVQEGAGDRGNNRRGAPVCAPSKTGRHIGLPLQVDIVNDRDFTTLHILTKDAWEDGAVTNGLISVGDEGLALTSETVYGLDRRLGLKGGIQPVALAANDCGVLTLLAGDYPYRFDPNGCSGAGTFERICCVGGTGSEVGRFRNPKGIALGKRDLYIADTGNNRVCAIALANYQVRWVIGAGEFNGPTDLVVDPCDHIYVLDTGNRRIQKFDQHGQPFSDLPFFGAGRLNNPVALALGMHDGAILVHCLDIGLMEIVTFDSGGEEVAAVSLAVLSFVPAGLATDEEGKFYISDQNRFIYVVRPDNTVTALEEYEGMAMRLVTGPRGTLYVIENLEVALLTKRRRYPPAWTASGAATGIYTSRVFDSLDDRRLWHRVVMDAVILEKTQVRLSYFIYPPGDDPISLPADSEWRVLPVNPEDALFERKNGRYLRLRLELISEDRHTTPQVKGLHLFFPKQSYLRYLPAAYQEDEGSREFLEKFLSLYESVFYDLEGVVFSTERLSDPWAAPASFLPWLGSWLALAWEEDWPEEAVRKLIATAHLLYRKRGTRQGFIDLIRLYTGKDPWIVEPFQLDYVRGRSDWALILRLFGDDPYRFTVLLPPEAGGRVDTVARIIDRERPAHTCAKVFALEHLFRLGGHTYMEVNTTLNEPVFSLEAVSSLSRQTYLADGEESGQIDVRTRLDIDTKLT